MAALFMMLILALIVIIFSVQNADTMTLKFIYWNFGLPKAVVLFICLIIGVIIAALLSMMTSANLKRNAKELELKLQEKENKIKELQKQVGNQDQKIV